eukprot:CAMPEP_0204825194 /NCGR_PEP_ID=MMETSP1346-20131115/3121_1 /ASSEMBLY_ACC=CAM_ASM_000771 /TAXON_ID=215587 /ORGANISM="Aplanochytrium stocchinoi, Strain GSBS06" /LENGTH=294 /DNA_ID=CAMNT_0051952721 /DNA_START=65 /DNA_END=946 /DNA_ORIENTATION=-
MGHAEGASGLMGLIKILLMYEDRTIYPNFDFIDSPHEPIKRGQFQVLQKAKEWTPAPTSISNFGFGGTNAFCILSPGECLNTVPVPKFENAKLNQCFSNYATEDSPPENENYGGFYAIQRLLGNHEPFKYEYNATTNKWKRSSPLVFVCDGQGSQWNGMGRELNEDIQGVLRNHRASRKYYLDPTVKLYEDGEKWLTKENGVLGIVSYQLGVIAMLRSKGINPDYFLGHSLGEIACGYLAGLQNEQEVMQTALVRSKLAHRIDPNTRFDFYSSQPERYDYRSGDYWVRQVAVSE